MILRDRHQAGVRSQDPQGQLDEAPALARHQAAAIRRTHAFRAQPLGVRLEVPHQLGGADARSPPWPSSTQRAGCSGAREPARESGR